MDGRLLLIAFLLGLFTSHIRAQTLPTTTLTTSVVVARASSGLQVEVGHGTSGAGPTISAPLVVAARALGGLQADGRHATSGGATTRWEVVGVCRATCVEQTLEWPPSDELCLQDDDCLTCWQLCERLYQDEIKWRSMCTEVACTIGCTTACKFSFNTVHMLERLPWEFPTTPTTTEVSDSALHVEWEAPRPRPQPKQEAPPRGRPHLVYTLLFMDESTQHWSRVTSTLDHITQVDGAHASFPGLRFLLIASTPAGTVARGIPPYPAPRPAPASTTLKPTVPPLPTHRTVSVRVITTADGRLEAEVTWFQETLPKPEAPRPKWVVTWVRETCNVNPDGAHCPLQEEEMSARIKAKDTRDMRVILTGLSYNSEYTLSLEGSFKSAAAFYTPTCAHLDATFMTCRPAPVTAPPSASRGTTYSASTTTVSEQEVPVRQRNSQQGPAPQPSLTPQLILLSVGISLGSIVILLISFFVYQRWCSSVPELDMAKVLQSYSELPLLTSYSTSPRNSIGSLHQLHLHNMTAQSLLNGSFATSIHRQMSPAHLHSPPTNLQVTPPGIQQYSDSIGHGSMAGSPGGSRQSLWPGVAIHVTPPASGATLGTVVTLDQPEMTTTSTPILKGQRARSMINLMATADQHHPVSQSRVSDTDLRSSSSTQRHDFFNVGPSPPLPLPDRWGTGVGV